MKLFFHWLLWDMRRFRVMLLGWTLLVLGYAGFLGWLHATILTVDPDWLGWSAPAGKLLLGVEVLMLLHLFSTDPAGGTDPFWKTRPPAGLAVAGSKLALAAGFFLGMPMVAWFAISAWCVLPGAATLEWEEGMSWTRFLWMMQTLVVGSMALGSAVIRTPWQVPLRLTVGLAVAASPALMVLLIKPFGLTVAGDVIARTGEGLLTPAASWLMLAAGCGIYGVVRRTRTPHPLWPWEIAMVPALLLMGVSLLPIRDDAMVRSMEKPAANPGVMKDFRVEGLSLRDGGAHYVLPVAFARDESYGRALYSVKLRVSGLPDNLPADGAGWRELKLTAPDGRTISAEPPPLPEVPIKRTGGENHQEISVANAWFDVTELASFSLLPCRAEGVLRILLQGRESAEMPIRPDTFLETPPAYYYLSADGFGDSRWMKTMTWTPRENLGSMKRLQLENVVGGESYEVSAGDWNADPGFLIQSRKVVSNLGIGESGEGLGFLRRMKELHGSGWADGTWKLRFSWSVPKGYVDVPVVLEPFILPRQFKDQRKLEDLVAAVPLQPEWDAARLKSAVLHVLTLANQRIKTQDSAEAVGRALEAWLARVPEAHAAMLLEVARGNLPDLKDRILDPRGQLEDLIMDGPLTSRIAELLPPSGLAEVRAERKLFHYLSPALLAAGLITEAETRRPEPQQMTDEALAGAWDRAGERGERDEWADDDRRDERDGGMIKILAEAAARGLPWAMPVTRELWELSPDGGNRYRIRDFMVPISDCPQDRRKGFGWLEKHLAKLQWDEGRKRWVLPEGEG